MDVQLTLEQCGGQGCRPSTQSKIRISLFDYPET